MGHRTGAFDAAGRTRCRDDDSDVLKGALVGAAVVGVAAAIANSSD